MLEIQFANTAGGGKRNVFVWDGHVMLRTIVTAFGRRFIGGPNSPSRKIAAASSSIWVEGRKGEFQVAIDSGDGVIGKDRKEETKRTKN